jgi:MFS transporter, FSR family, fosmidomycin resistance protein
MSTRRTLFVAGLTHALHDGYTDTIYVLLPVWQREFALSYGVLALLRGLYSGTMAALQVPAGTLGARFGFGGRTLLALGTALSAVGYLLAGLSGGVLGLGAALVIGGAGSSTQHPTASSAVSRAFGANARGPLGVYNFAGDLGKAAVPAGMSILVTVVAWRHAVGALAAVGFLVAAAIGLLMPETRGAAAEAGAATESGRAQSRVGFWLLLAVGVLDSATRMGFLIFLPFLLEHKGASLPEVGMALALVFLGGAAGKITCGWLGARIGVLRTVLATEGGTAAAIILVLLLPLLPAFVVLPVLGVMLNGTSSVLYGTVPELAEPGRTEQAFALFYTGTIGSGALAPVLYGILGDAAGVSSATLATAATALATIPLALLLAPRIAATQIVQSSPTG